MEDARKASMWAQQLDARCSLLCNQSVQGTHKMQLEVNRCLELRIQEEEFWIAELHGRNAAVKEVLDNVRALERRLVRAVSVINTFSAVNQECIKQRSKRFPDVGVINVQLLDESRMLRNARDAIENTTMKTMEIQAQLLSTSRALEEDAGSKEAALRTDKRSLDLPKQQIHRVSFSALYDSTELVQEIPKVAAINAVHWKPVPSDVNLRVADEQMRLSELHLEESDTFLKNTTELIASETAKGTQVMREHNGDLQKEKNDLQQHLDMTNAHMEVTNETLHRLSNAITDKEHSINVALHRLQLHSARPLSELQHVDKDIWIVLERELAASRAELEDLLDQVPALEASQRSLRRSRLQIGKEIQKNIQLIETEELKCLAVRVAHMNSINL